ncbi:hypothetical protein [uncultured Oscillibacter sp.]|uniref:hypothetical protein n=1 Tax=uncultured Oscillibacter sp. TaxID=876091 RepID=UPI0025EAD0A4|nr:hypothetical protein [uncultured Oscillibacter sp.]
MGWLVGLPLGIFRLLAGCFMLALRLAVPILVIAVVIFLLRRARRRDGGGAEPPREPEFRGPVYTVDYEDVEDGPENGAAK